MSLIEDIKADRPQFASDDTFYWCGDVLCATEFGEAVELFSATWSTLDEFQSENKARIARVPQMEAALLAAEELARLVSNETQADGGREKFHITWKCIDEALDAYRIATGAA